LSLLDKTKPGDIVYVDIDETICNTPGNKNKERDYTKSTPIQSRINMVNELFDNNRRVVYWSARGVGSGKNHTALTLEQFKKWGVKFHQLSFNKPLFNLLIDDKAFNSEDM